MLSSTSRMTLVVAGFLALAGRASGQDEFRRQLLTPGLVLNLGARNAPCDELRFTSDGKFLLAAGDDKVVRSWPVGVASFTEHRSRDLRWPIYLQQRGGIFSFALSSDEKLVAITGFGVKTGMVAVLDRQTGQLLHTLPKVTSDKVNWKVVIAPSNRQLIFGTDDGSVLSWDFAAGEKEAVVRKGPGKPRSEKETSCKVRYLGFLSDNPSEKRFLVVTEDGTVAQGSLTETSVRTIGVIERPGQKHPELFRVVLSPDRRTLAATGFYYGGATRPGGPTPDLRSVVLFPLLDGAAGLALGKRELLRVPQKENELHHPITLTFDPTGRRLAVGVRVLPTNYAKGDPLFNKEIDGYVHVYNFPVASGGEPSATVKVDVRPEAIAFRPGKTQLATAGGNNHEVRLWDVSGPGTLLDTIEGPGACIWSVGLSKDGHTLGFRQKRAPNPRTPNSWGAGKWRVLKLVGTAGPLAPDPKGPLSRAILDTQDFEPIAPLEEDDGWYVRFSDNGAVWSVVDPDDRETPLNRENGLFDPAVYNLPRCYTFLPRTDPKQPVRLAVGHTWGISLYECVPKNVRLIRRFIGHEGDVMALASSADGRLLVSGARDQTIACWSVDDWPHQAQLGASFASEAGKLIVGHVAPGSPAWELGLSDGDEIITFIDSASKFAYNTSGKTLRDLGITLPGKGGTDIDTALTRLRAAKGSSELIFWWKPVKGVSRSGLTTLKQRPLWRLFPTRGAEFVIWRPQDFYYATNATRADDYLGWHLNVLDKGVDRTPEFLPLSQFAARFHRPDRIWPSIFEMVRSPDRVAFANIEPPGTTLQAAVDGKVASGNVTVKTEKLELILEVKPHGSDKEQGIQRVSLWLNDHRYPGLKVPDPKTGLQQRIAIPLDELRDGINRITLVGVNENGGRGQAVIEVLYLDPRPERKARLFALCVGVNGYKKVKGRLRFPDLRCSENDAAAMASILRDHGESALYSSATVETLSGAAVTRAAIYAKLREMGAQARPNDWLVVFLSGHGFAPPVGAGEAAPESFFFVTPDLDFADESTRLYGKALAEELAKMKCRKLIVLDACHSGSIAADPIRSLILDGVPLLVFTACRHDQQAQEPVAGAGQNGLFTEALLAELTVPGRVKKPRLRPLTGNQLAERITTAVPARLKKLADDVYQDPVFFPKEFLDLPVFCRP
jgi:WD40 repeat protein